MSDLTLTPDEIQQHLTYQAKIQTLKAQQEETKLGKMLQDYAGFVFKGKHDKPCALAVKSEFYKHNLHEIIPGLSMLAMDVRMNEYEDS